MRRVIGGFFQSLDGVIQAPGGPDEDPAGGFAFGGWATSHFDEALGEFLDGVFVSGDDYDLLLGRRTYEIFAAHWPYNRDEPIGARFAAIRKYVVTATPELLTWEGSEALVGDPAETVAALKAGDGPDLLIQGSSELYPALLGAGLIDRLFVMTMPLLLGRGKRAWTDAATPGALKLVDHRVTSAGVMVGVYEPAGPVTTGDFGMAEPSAAELARRQKWAREEGQA